MAVDHTITCEQLADKIRPFMRRHVATLVAACLAIVAWMFFSERSGSLPLVIVAAGSLLPIFAWNAQTSASLPLGPLIGLQSLIIYGTPLVVQNRTVFIYPPDDILRGAIEVFIFLATLTGGWLLAFKNTNDRRPATYLRFRFIGAGHIARLTMFGMLLMGISVAFHVANIAGAFRSMPVGVLPVVRTIGDATGVGGSLLCGYFIGSGVMNGSRTLSFWALFLVHCVFTSSNYTLFPVTALIIAVSIGVFLGRGRVPFVMLAIFTVAIGFFNLSKFEMRKAYWVEGVAYAQQELSILPDRYGEWARRSWEHVFGGDEFKADREGYDGQHVSDRINNLVNLLDVQSYVLHDKVPVLGGETYTIIPALLIPRAFWPDKPRTHEGMVLLNVHYGKQTVEESFYTYISWGLLPEAYGNFGPFWGALLCGGVLGLVIGWLESWSRYYPLISLQALIFMSLLVQFGSSFEMVASLWITSVFQMLVATLGGTLIFVEKAAFPSDES